jgi:alkylation response protein AidB-like acyl-CoA dehydrogenase
MVRGRKVGAFLLTEPQAGSDAQALTTRAERGDGGWVITGEKAWVSNGAFADVLSVYAQTDPGAGAKGISSFLIDANAPGVKRAEPYHLMRGHALGAGGFSFDACKVRDDMMLLGPSEAFKGAMSGINTARITVAAMCCGMLRESLSQAVRYAETREAFGQSILEFQGLQWMLADVATDLEAAKLLTARAVELIDAGDAVTVAAAHAKKYATRVAFSGIADCMQAMGAAGYSADYPLARHLAAAKMAQFIDGTTEIQNVVIGRALKSEYAS